LSEKASAKCQREFQPICLSELHSPTSNSRRTSSASVPFLISFPSCFHTAASYLAPNNKHRLRLWYSRLNLTLMSPLRLAPHIGVSKTATTPEGVVVGIDSIVGALGDEAEVAEVGIAGEIGGYVLVGLLGRVSCYPSLTNCQVRSRSRY